MDMALKGLKVLDFSTLYPGLFRNMVLSRPRCRSDRHRVSNSPRSIRLMPPYANGQATAQSYSN